MQTGTGRHRLMVLSILFSSLFYHLVTSLCPSHCNLIILLQYQFRTVYTCGILLHYFFKNIYLFFFLINFFSIFAFLIASGFLFAFILQSHSSVGLQILLNNLIFVPLDKCCDLIKLFFVSEFSFLLHSC